MTDIDLTDKQIIHFALVYLLANMDHDAYCDLLYPEAVDVEITTDVMNKVDQQIRDLEPQYVEQAQVEETCIICDKPITQFDNHLSCETCDAEAHDDCDAASADDGLYFCPNCVHTGDLNYIVEGGD